MDKGDQQINSIEGLLDMLEKPSHIDKLLSSNKAIKDELIKVNTNLRTLILSIFIGFMILIGVSL
jgi:hypothetical protein